MATCGRSSNDPGGADAPSRGPARWTGRTFIAVGRALYLGPSFDTAPHAHHAIQICVGLDGGFRLRPDGSAPWSNFEGAIVPSDCGHQLDGRGADLLLVYLEPETPAGRRARFLEGEPRIRSLAPDRVEALRRAARSARSAKLDADGAERLHDALLEQAGFAGDAATAFDERIAEAVRRLQQEGRTRGPLAALARSVGLSPSRFRHLFFEQMGISCRRYVLWLRLLDAIEAASCGASATEAALEAGFSDAAHLTRTFRRMFGIPPSAVFRSISSMG